MDKSILPRFYKKLSYLMPFSLLAVLMHNLHFASFMECKCYLENTIIIRCVVTVAFFTNQTTAHDFNKTSTAEYNESCLSSLPVHYVNIEIGRLHPLLYSYHSISCVIFVSTSLFLSTEVSFSEESCPKSRGRKKEVVRVKTIFFQPALL